MIINTYLMHVTKLFTQSGGECMVLPMVTKDEATKLFPEHVVKSVPSGKEYMRITPQP